MLLRLLLFFTLTGSAVFSQTPVVQWQTKIGGSLNETGLKIDQSFDETLFIAGTVESSDSGTDIYVSHRDVVGNDLWNKKLSSAGQDTLIAIAACQDGGVVLLCYSDSTVGTDFNQKGAYLVKFSHTGTLVFKEFHGGNPVSTGAVIETSDGGYLFLSSKISQKKDLWLLKTDGSGVKNWDKTFGGTEDEIPGDLLEESQNFYLIGESLSGAIKPGNTDPDKDLIWIKTDFTGNSPSTKYFGGTNSEFGPKMDKSKVVAGDIQLIISCSTNSSDLLASPFYHGGVDVWAFSTDLSGNQDYKYHHYLGDFLNDYSSGVSFGSDATEDPVVAYYSFNTFGVQNEPSVPNLITSQLTPFGGNNWSLVIGGSGDDHPSDLIYSFDGGYFVSGQSNSASAGGFDHWLVKIGKSCLDIQPINLGTTTYLESLSRTNNNSITTASKFEGIPTHINLRSKAVIMNPGFEVQSGVVFKAESGGCP